MRTRELGTSGLEVSAIGLGCMGMSFAYGTPDDPESIRTIHRALELGVDFLDTAQVYAMGKNETLVGEALKGKRDRVFLATKFGIARDRPSGCDSRPEAVKASCEGSLERLLTILNMPMHIFNDNNGVIHDEANRYHHRQQGQQVDGEPHHPDQKQDANQRQGNGDNRNGDDAQGAQEQEDHQDNNDRCLHQGAGHFLQCFADVLRKIGV